MKRKLIVLMGLDGSGKSTQAERASEWLASRGIPTEVVWMRGESYLTRPVIRIGKALLRAPRENKRGGGIESGEDYGQYVDGKQAMFKNRFLRAVWRMLTITDLYITFRLSFRSVGRDTRVVILDRYVYDSLIDIDSAFGSGGTEAVRMLDSLLLRLFPRPDMVFLLEISPEEAMKRKDDIPSIVYLEERYDMYLKFAEITGAIRVDATASIEQVQSAIRDRLREDSGLKTQSDLEEANRFNDGGGSDERNGSREVAE
jgi:thymidylate kinase